MTDQNQPLPPTPQPETELPEDVAIYISSLEESLSATDGCDYGGGCWIDMWGMKKDPEGNKHYFKVNMTSHARTPAGAADNLFAGMQHVMDKYHLLPYDPREKGIPAQNAAQQPVSQPAHINTPAAPAAPAVGAPTAPASVSAPAAPGAPAAAQPAQAATGGSFVTGKIEVTMRADGKADVKCYKNTQPNKYPELTITRSPEQLAKMFSEGTGAAWTPAHFSAPAVYSTPIKITWTPSTKTNSQGNPYKDVKEISNP